MDVVRYWTGYGADWSFDDVRAQARHCLAGLALLLGPDTFMLFVFGKLLLLNNPRFSIGV